MSKKFKHLMLDIETLGTKSNSAIISIGAVEFDIETGETGETFYRNVSLKSSVDSGLIIDPDTVMWWLGQDLSARKSLTEGGVTQLPQALLDFNDFCTKDYEVWGNSARFDLGIMSNAYEKTFISIPWNFRLERCVRTLVSLNPSIKDNIVFKGTAHNALHDCYHQIKYCSETFNSFEIKKVFSKEVITNKIH